MGLLHTLISNEDELAIHCLDVRLAATADTKIEGWIGAVLRNNLLFAAEQITLDNGTTFREFLGKIPLPEDHPLYKNLAKGFPAPYIITPSLGVYSASSQIILNKGDIFSFRLTLIGSISQYCRYFLESIIRMSSRGFGSPMKPFVLIDVFENGKNDSNLLLAGGEILKGELQYPITLSNYISKAVNIVRSNFTIQFSTPVSLYKLSKKKGESFQDKLNGFPSFYQIIRSVSYRLIKLIILYSYPNDNKRAVQLMSGVEDYLQDSSSFLLQSASIQYVRINGAIQKEKESRMQLTGYVGELQFIGTSKYFPLLIFMQVLGIGDNVPYGMGHYTIKINRKINKN